MRVITQFKKTKLHLQRANIVLLVLLMISEPAFAQQDSFNSGSIGTNVFHQLQQNVWYLPTADSQSTLYITELGSKGPPIVVLHGGPGNNFNYLVKPLTENLDKHKFILFDQRGSLLSPVPDSNVNNLSVDILVQDLETLRRSIDQEKLILFGHSFGTFLAMAYYIKYPQHVQGLVLTASVPPFTTPSFTLTDFSKEMSRLRTELRERREVKQLMEALGVLLDSGLDARQKSIRTKIDGRASFNIYRIEKWNEFEGGGIYYNSKVGQAIGNTMKDIYDIRPRLDKFPIPIYVIQGDHDFVDPAGRRWAELIKQYPSVRLSVLKDAGHYGWIDDPALFQQYFEASLRYAVSSVK